jgi:dihydrofolate synthase/folylpolyglutamate synthase
MQQVQEQKFENLHLVLGFVNDKDLDKIIPLFPKNAKYYLSKPNIPRGLDEKLAQEKFKEFNIETNIYKNIPEAYLNALVEANENDFIYIGGSTFVVAEVL